MLRSLIVCGSVILGVSSQPSVARAQEYEPKEYKPEIGSEYFWDGGVIPFFYVAGAVGLGLRLFAEPVDTPILFPTTEGGAEDHANTIPEAVVTGYSLGFAALIAAAPRAERWHHLKGFGEAVITTLALTEIVKDGIGRRRPHYQEEMHDVPDLRRSFFSGHASITAAGTVYMGLYLTRNLLPRPSLLRTAGVLALGSLFVYVPYTRVDDKRHHLSDVITGAAVGSAIATAFYVYQEGRFRGAEEAHRQKRRLQLVPNFRNPGLALAYRW